MKLSYFFIIVFSLFLTGCASKKGLAKKNRGAVIAESKPVKLPSVDQKKHIKKLQKKNPRLNKNVLDYIQKYAPIAVQEMYTSKIPASITLAQGILESGSGRSELARKSNNHFGIKCHKKWLGERVKHDDDSIGECFRKYQFVETSYKDHSAFLTKRKRYAFLFDYGRKDYKKWAKGLKKAGYATDKKYPQKLITLIKTYKLYEFDSYKKKNFKVKKFKKRRKTPLKVKASKKQSAITYSVKEGDTLYSISIRFNTSVAQLKALNQLKNNNLNIGQVLIVK